MVFNRIKNTERYDGVTATSLSDGTATLSNGTLSNVQINASTVSSTTLTDGTATLTGGALTGATSVSATSLTDGVATLTTGLLTGLVAAGAGVLASAPGLQIVPDVNVTANSVILVNLIGPINPAITGPAFITKVPGVNFQVGFNGSAGGEPFDYLILN
jgi:hypothetical protein